jgi:hypothetical protein
MFMHSKIATGKKLTQPNEAREEGSTKERVKTTFSQVE